MWKHRNDKFKFKVTARHIYSCTCILNWVLLIPHWIFHFQSVSREEDVTGKEGGIRVLRIIDSSLERTTMLNFFLALFLELCSMMNIFLLQVDSIWSARTHFTRHTCGARTAFINEISFPSAIKTLWSTSVMLASFIPAAPLYSSILYVMKDVPWVTVQMSVSGAPRSYSPLVFLSSTPLASVMTGLETGAVEIKQNWNVNDRLPLSIKFNLLITARWIRYWRVGDFLKSTRHL